MRPVLSVAPLLLFACVNGDDTSGPPAGSLGGPCLTNGTCDAGLECVLENGKGTCEQPDATVDATVDQSAADAPAEATSDAGTDAPAEACAAIPQEPCPGKGACLTGCCATTGYCANSSKCTDNSTPWSCVNGANCGDAGLCCIGITIEDAGTCPPVAISTPSACHGGGICTAGQNALCTSNTDCPPSAPTCTTILVEGMTTPVGVCQ